MQDGVDYIPMPTWKVFMIQFLNIAGTGPIFGAIMGAKFGPSCYLWIVLGCIFGGAVHDYLSGMISVRKNGATLPELIGSELHWGSRSVIIIFTTLVLLMVGAVFVYSPALILGDLAGDGSTHSMLIWVFVILAYYIIATLLPVDKIIGKIYPVFAFALIFMAVSLLVCLIIKWPTITQYRQAQEEGLLADLEEVWEKYASPELKVYRDQYPDSFNAVSVDGHLFGFPYMEDNFHNAAFLWIRDDWLKNLNAEPPKTIDEMVALARRFTFEDPDGNGKDDTYGLGLQGMVATNNVDKFDVDATVTGGGFTGQAGAIRHGIARALLQVDESYRATLKAAGLLTRDPRMKERKKYGLKAARRAPQFSKR